MYIRDSLAKVKGDVLETLLSKKIPCRNLIVTQFVFCMYVHSTTAIYVLKDTGSKDHLDLRITWRGEACQKSCHQQLHPCKKNGAPCLFENKSTKNDKDLVGWIASTLATLDSSSPLRSPSKVNLSPPVLQTSICRVRSIDPATNKLSLDTLRHTYALER